MDSFIPCVNTTADFSSQFQNEYEEIQKSLKDVDETIKRITGRDPAIIRQNPRRNQGGVDFRNRDRQTQGFFRTTPESGANLEAISTKGRGPGFNRFQTGERVNSRFKKLRYFPTQNDESPDEDEPPRKVTLQSSVVATPKEVRTRRDSIETQKGDKKVMDRNRRMFGMILGTLQKFQSEESKRKDQAQKRAEIEQKLEAAASKEKEELRKERQSLFVSRREKQAHIRRLEQKIEIAKLHDEWETRQKHLMAFNMTKTLPAIFYKPKKSSPESEKRLLETREKLEYEVLVQKAKIVSQLAEIDELYIKGVLRIEDEEDEMDHETDQPEIARDKENLGPEPGSPKLVIEGPELPISMDTQGKVIGGDSGAETGLPVQDLAIDETKVKEETGIQGDLVSTKEVDINKEVITSDVKMDDDEKPLDTIGDLEFIPIYD